MEEKYKKNEKNMEFGCTAAVSQKASQHYLQAAEAFPHPTPPPPPPYSVRNVLVQRLLAAFSYGDKSFLKHLEFKEETGTCRFEVSVDFTYPLLSGEMRNHYLCIKRFTKESFQQTLLKNNNFNIFM